MKEILKTFLKRLTNLTARNRSLVLLRLPKTQFFDVHQLDFLLGESSFSIVEQLVDRRKSISLCDYTDPRNERSNAISKQLLNISRTEKLIVEERGAEDLYVGYPFIQGKFSDGTAIRCPLLFFPVTLTIKTVQKKVQWCLEKRDTDVVFNRSFLLAYSHFTNTPISDDWLDFSFDNFPKNSLEFRTALYELMKKSPFEINFNQDLFANQLIEFEQLNKSVIEENERNGELKLYSQAVLGIFPQAGSYIAADYENLLENPDDLPDNFADFFGRNEDENHKIIREENLLLPLATDSSQETVVREVKMGNSVVVQGPPGTGKSQLIGNLIADFTAQGKRVLVVCQKRAALDTVYERLVNISMEQFMGLVHDFKTDRKKLFDKIADQIDHVDDYQKQNAGLNTIFLERSFDQTCREIDRTVRELDELKKALFDEKVAGKSVKEMYLRLAAFTDIPGTVDLSTLYQFFKLDELPDFLNKVEQRERYNDILNDKSAVAAFWKKRLSTENWQLNDSAIITKNIHSLSNAFQKFRKGTATILEKQIPFSTIPDGFTDNITKISELITDEETLRYFHRFNQKNDWKAHTLSINLFEKYKTELKNIANAGIDKRLFRHPEIEKILLTANDALPAAESFLKKTTWQLFSNYRKEWRWISNDFNVNFTSTDLLKLAQETKRAMRFGEIIDEVKSFEIDLSEITGEGLIKIVKLQNARTAFDALLPIFRNSQLTNETNLFAFRKLCYDLQDLEISTRKTVVENAVNLTGVQLTMLEQITNPIIITDYLRNNFDYLIEADQLTASFSATEHELIATVDSAQSDLPLTGRIQYNLLRHWIAHVENLHPILRGVSTLKINDLEKSLQENILKKQELCEAIVLLKLRETTYKNLEHNRLGNLMTYRELYHQTTKKRQLWSVRKLLENFSDEIFNLLPCWLASPETVSAIFPLKNDTFDVVIFDEASQCYVEHGLPAALRGKQVVIAGDNQQLQPSDLYQVRFEEDSTDEPLLEIDSLLDIAAQYLPQTQLKGHYRSRSLDLISFSNQYFYKNRLRLLPDFQHINSKKTGIEYLKVDGIWENNRNKIEADKVIEIIQQTNPTTSIGVVTFNFKQAELIADLLRNTEGNFENVRVKNIENIQGDEFDMVIFSVGYAPDGKGKLLMNFGTLNQSGGENRLNVAITRAKEKALIVTSILPHELNVADSKNDGPKLLQAYLQFALDVSDGKFEPQPYISTAFRSELTLKTKLAKNDPSLSETLPFADLTVEKNNDYISLILTDDELYFDSPSSKDAHGYLPLLLIKKGWPFERKWSRGVMRN